MLSHSRQCTTTLDERRRTRQFLPGIKGVRHLRQYKKSFGKGVFVRMLIALAK